MLHKAETNNKFWSWTSGQKRRRSRYNHWMWKPTGYITWFSAAERATNKRALERLMAFGDYDGDDTFLYQHRHTGLWDLN